MVNCHLVNFVSLLICGSIVAPVYGHPRSGRQAPVTPTPVPPTTTTPLTIVVTVPVGPTPVTGATPAPPLAQVPGSPPVQVPGGSVPAPTTATPAVTPAGATTADNRPIINIVLPPATAGPPATESPAPATPGPTPPAPVAQPPGPPPGQQPATRPGMQPGQPPGQGPRPPGQGPGPQGPPGSAPPSPPGGTPPGTPAPPGGAPGGTTQDVQQQCLDLQNAQRQGLTPFQSGDPTIIQAAQRRAQEICASFAHYNVPAGWLENIAFQGGGDRGCDVAVNMWLTSPGHLRQIKSTTNSFYRSHSKTAILWKVDEMQWHHFLIARLAFTGAELLYQRNWFISITGLYCLPLLSWSMANSRLTASMIKLDSLNDEICAALINRKHNMQDLKERFNELFKLMPFVLIATVFVESAGLIVQLQERNSYNVSRIVSATAKACSLVALLIVGRSCPVSGTEMQSAGQPEAVVQIELCARFERSTRVQVYFRRQRAANVGHFL
ncbi:hypothetical protein HDE_01275 [Halotydeus destructor]|nr:hypothetical protein HDE_01275 [Halotydeus destructor]